MRTGAGLLAKLLVVLCVVSVGVQRVQAQSCTISDSAGFICEPYPMPLIQPGGGPPGWDGPRARQWPVNNGGTVGQSISLAQLSPNISTSVNVWTPALESGLQAAIALIVTNALTHIFVASPSSWPTAGVPPGVPRPTGNFAAIPRTSATTPNLGDDPIGLVNGEMVYESLDLALPSRGVAFALSRTYRARLDYASPLGFGWTHSYDQKMIPGPGRSGLFQTGNGAVLRFRATGTRVGSYSEVDPTRSGSVTIVDYVAPAGFAGRLLGAAPNGNPVDWKLIQPDGTVRFFRGDTNGARLRRIEDQHALGLTLAWTNDRLATVTDSAGRVFEFRYDASHHLEEVREATSGWSAHYQVDANGDLITATTAQHRVERFEYDAGHDPGNEAQYAPEGVVREACDEACRPTSEGGYGVCEAPAAAAHQNCLVQVGNECATECRDTTCATLDVDADCDWGGTPGSSGCFAQCADGCADPAVLDAMCESAVAPPICESMCHGQCDRYCLQNIPVDAPEGWFEECYNCCRYGFCEIASCNFGLDCATECRKAVLDEPTQLFDVVYGGHVYVNRDCPNQADDAPNCPDQAPIICPTRCVSRCHASCVSGAKTACRAQCPASCAAKTAEVCDAADFYTPCQATCVPSCIAAERGRGPSGPKYGHLRDLDHNLLRVRDGGGQIVVDIQYGQDLSQPSFDAVTWQRNGEGELELWYRDLRGEEEGIVEPPSDPTLAALVTPRSSYDVSPICGNHAGPLPVRATVARDAFGVLSTSYFDAGGLLLRHVNHDTTAVRSYEYDAKSRLSGERKPLGGKVCQYWGDGNTLLQRTLIATPGSEDPPIVWRFDYQGTDVKRLWHAYDPRTQGTVPLWTYEYNANGDLVGMTNRLGERTALLPRADGLVERVYAPLEEFVTAFQYDDTTGVLTGSVKGPDGDAPVVTSAEVDSTGLPIVRIHERGLRDEMVWQDGRLLSLTRMGDGHHSRSTLYYLEDVPLGGSVENEAGVATMTWAQVRDPLGRPRRLIETADGVTRTTCTRHGNDGRILEEVRADGVRYLYEYDGEGRPTALRVGALLPDPTGWDAECPIPAEVLAPRVIASWEYDLDGNLRRTEEDGGVTEHIPDGHGRPRLTRVRTGLWTFEERNELGSVLWRGLVGGTTPPTTKPVQSTLNYFEMTEYGYDDAGELISTSVWEGATSRQTTTVVQTRIPRIVEAHDGTQTWELQDAAGRPLTRRLPDGTYQGVTYAPGGRSVTLATVAIVDGQAVLRGQLNQLDAWGNVIKTEAVAPSGNLTLAEREADEFGRIKTEKVAGQGLTRYEYDGFGRRLVVERAAEDSTEREVTHLDAAGRVETVSSSLSGLGGGGAPAVTTFHYDELDRLISVTRPDGLVTGYTYVGDGLRSDTIARPGGETQRWTYDSRGLPDGLALAAAAPTPYKFNALGWLFETDSVFLAHDNRGNTIRQKDSLSSSALNLLTTRSFLATAGTAQLRWGTPPIGIVQDNDGLGRPLTVSSKTSNATYEIARYRYQGLDGPLERLSPTAGLITTYEYDAYGRLASMTTSRQGATVAKRVWKRSAGGAPYAELTQVNGAWRTRLFDLDSRSRVRMEVEGTWAPEALPEVGPFSSRAEVQAAWNAKLPEATSYRTYGLDARGNWVQVGGSAGSDAPSVGAADRYTTFQGAPVDYDGNGQVRAIGATDQFTYSVDGRLTSATRGSSTLTTGSDGTLRTVSITGGGPNLKLGYVGAHLAGVRIGSEAFYRAVARGPAGEPIAIVSATAPQTPQVLITDDQGSVYLTADQNGLTSSTQYSAFGEPTPRNVAGTELAEMPSPFGFHGHIQRRSLGLVLMGARWYRPAWGRFLTPDPIDLAGGTNRYAFVYGAPGLYVDPSGLRAEFSPAGIASAGSAAPERFIGEAGPSVWRVYGELSEGQSRIVSDMHLAFRVAEANGSPNHLSRAIVDGPGVYRQVLFRGGAIAGDFVFPITNDRSTNARTVLAYQAWLSRVEGSQHVIALLSLAPGGQVLPVVDALLRREYVEAAVFGAIGVAGLAGGGIEAGWFAKGLATRGGTGPVRQGLSGVERAIADLETAGGEVLGREITIEAGGVRTRPDLFVKLPGGKPAFLEIKTGDAAKLTRNQRAAFPVIWTHGGIPRGANAAAAGLTPGVPIGPTPVWTIYYPWPLP